MEGGGGGGGNPPGIDGVNNIWWFCFTGLMADQTGNYVYSFYMAGGALLTSFLIPTVLIALDCRKSRVHRQNFEEAVTERLAPTEFETQDT